jgi:hypothetical protein
MILRRFLAALAVALVAVHMAGARKHHLSVEKDPRRFFPISTFGFYTRYASKGHGLVRVGNQVELRAISKNVIH